MIRNRQLWGRRAHTWDIDLVKGNRAQLVSVRQFQKVPLLASQVVEIRLGAGAIRIGVTLVAGIAQGFIVGRDVVERAPFGKPEVRFCNRAAGICGAEPQQQRAWSGLPQKNVCRKSNAAVAAAAGGGGRRRQRRRQNRRPSAATAAKVAAANGRWACPVWLTSIEARAVVGRCGVIVVRCQRVHAAWSLAIGSPQNGAPQRNVEQTYQPHPGAGSAYHITALGFCGDNDGGGRCPIVCS